MVTICLRRTDLGRVSSDVVGLGIWNLEFGMVYI